MNWQTILENIPDLVLVTEEDGTILRASQGFQKDLGHDPSELVGTDIEDLFGDGEMLAMLGIDSVFEDEEEVSDLTLLFRNSEEESVGCLASGRRIIDEGKTCFILVARPHGETQEALAQSSREAAKEREQRALLEQILNTLVDAVFMVDENFVIQPLFSKSCERVFGVENLEGQDANKLIFSRYDETDEIYELHLAAMKTAFGEEEFAWYFNDHVFIDQVPYAPPSGDEDTEDRILQLRYAPLLDDNDLIHRVLFIVSDVTELRSLEAAADEASRTASVVLALSEGDNTVRNMFFDAEADRIKDIEQTLLKVQREGEISDSDKIVTMRALHTLKGNSKLMKFEELAQIAHVVEYLILESEEGFDPILEEFEKLKLRFEKIVELRDRISQGDSEGNSESSTLRLLSEFVQTSDDVQPFETLSNLQSLLSGALREENVSLLRTMKPLAVMAEHVATRLEKQIDFQMAESTRNEVYLSSRIAQSVLDAMTHGVRNAVDHGIELPQTRAAANKSETGTIDLGICYDTGAGCLVITLTDDGGGINVSAIERRAREKGIIPQDHQLSEEALRNLVFEPNFSTREEATEISGRGVGLDAARVRLREIGGDIKLDHGPDGVGSCFSVLIPSRHLEVAYVGGKVVRGSR